MEQEHLQLNFMLTAEYKDKFCIARVDCSFPTIETNDIYGNNSKLYISTLPYVNFKKQYLFQCLDTDIPNKIFYLPTFSNIYFAIEIWYHFNTGLKFYIQYRSIGNIEEFSKKRELIENNYNYSNKKNKYNDFITELDSSIRNNEDFPKKRELIENDYNYSNKKIKCDDFMDES
jgi:hypothetical protein